MENGWSRLIALALASLASGCTTDGTDQSARPSTTSVGDTSSSIDASLAPCDATFLSLSATSEDGATGHGLTTIVITLSVASTPSCSLEGYAAATLVSPGAPPVEGEPSDSGFMYNGGPPQPVLLEPGTYATFGIETTHICDDGANPQTATQLDVTIEGEPVPFNPPVLISHCGAALIHPFVDGGPT